jgi:hypothetical protein
MLLSDLYGTYTGEFLSNTSVVRTLQKTFDSILRENRISMRIGESRGTLSLTVSGGGLVDPVLTVYRNDRRVAEESLRAGSFLTYGAAIPLNHRGHYTAILYSGGTPLTRFPLYFNGNMEGQTTESHLAPTRHKTLVFKLLRADRIYLVLFFLSSVAVTFLSRHGRLKTRRGKW